MNRRHFLKSSAVGLGGILILPSCVSKISPYSFFYENEAKCVIAMCEQIIPSDENGPGATTAGVIYYIDKQLDEVFLWEQDNYRNGITAIQLSCSKLYNKKFEELDFDTQTEFLILVETDKLTGNYWKQNNPSKFFSTVINHTKQGFYGPPRHGGNKNYLSYRMLDFEYPQVVGQNRYRGEHVK